MSSHASAIVRRDTRAWRVQVRISFAVAVTLCGSGLAYLPGQDLDRAFMAMGYVFCMSAVFALSKFVRDNLGRKVHRPMWSLVRNPETQPASAA